jgi:hypothetical protein
MSDERMARSRFGHLTPGLVIFVFYKLLGILWDLAFILFTLLWALPTMSKIPRAQENVPDLVGEVMLPTVSIVAVIVGLVLLARGAEVTRRFWIIYLALYALSLFWEMLSSPEPTGPIIFLLGSIGWVAYWVHGAAPRRIAFLGRWQPAQPGSE